MNWHNQDWALAALLLVCACGCGSEILHSPWHEKYAWNAEDYFDDPQVIALCHAIETNDLKEIDRLIAAGANVNSKGKGNMTPLLWAFPDNKLDRFKLLLEHGADPNVIVESDFGTRGAITPGEAVTHMACDTTFPGYFEAVFSHGADPNLATSASDPPLFRVIKSASSDKLNKIHALIKLGADVNHQDYAGGTPAMTAVGWGGQYELALELLEAGANPHLYQSNELQKLSHVVARQEFTDFPSSTPKQKADFGKLTKWLEEHGESVQEARDDLARWEKWNAASGEFFAKSRAEIAARNAREAREKEAAKKPEQKR